MIVQHIVRPWPVFSFLFLYTIGKTPWTGDQSDERKATTYTQDNTNTE
jgi:hypothetical protein